MEPRFIIFVETITGDIIEAFTWCRDEMSGIARAQRDAREFGVTPLRIWATPV
jgi:hypothetical protein